MIRQVLSANMREFVTGMILLTNRKIRSKVYSTLGVTMIALGHFIQSLGRKEHIRQKNFLLKLIS
ncbi:hypothetical protein [Sporolactobacillus pectinivorans]|uniref:hypothetical protein n=1 Tax=Sporolactobacillus pectinivorans TaxID=1591408 RepID=UPI001EFC8299|nr:hypothetical protein [Sporolactobacillus pectinivorans]